MSYGIKVYTSNEVHAEVENSFNEKTIPISRMKSKRIGSFTVIPFQVPHNGTECDGFIIKHEEIGNMLFITDAEYCPYNFSKYGINQALIECNYSKKYVGAYAENRSHVFLGHMELETCKRLIETISGNSLRNVCLLHLSSANGNPVEFRREIKDVVDSDVDVFIAEKGFHTELSLMPF